MANRRSQFVFHVITVVYINLGFPATDAEVVHLVGASLNYVKTDIARRVDFQCYRSGIDIDSSIRFGRYISTRGNESETPEPVTHSKNQEHLQVIKFRNVTQAERAYGVFYCQGSKEGRDPTSVLGFYLRSDAKFFPHTDTFTQTVNAGETGVQIDMTVLQGPDRPGSMIRWRFNGSDPIASQDNQTVFKIPHPVTTADEGVYEIYYEGERESARGALFRLIVRDCPANRWGPPNCEGVCDKCYNGGVCDDQSGQCICPNGFQGPNCLTICNLGGGNRFGLNCEFRCSYVTDGRNRCRGSHFCLPDPFGCTCDTGSMGLNCRTACFNGRYGASCTQQCHCRSGQCGIYTGECTGVYYGCTEGWSGENCQIPDVCEPDYYGVECTQKCHCLNGAPCDKVTGACSNGECAKNHARYDGTPECQACKSHTFGYNCSEACHCETEACDKELGECRGKCLGNWLPPNCVRGVSRLETNIIVNPGQSANVTCHVIGTPPPDPASVYLHSNSGRSSYGAGIVQRASTITDSGVTVDFEIESVGASETFSCILTEDGRVAVLEVESTTYELPAIANPPTISAVSTDDVTIQWQAWLPGEDIGDPPLVGYKVFHRMAGASQWLEGVINASSAMEAHSAKIVGLLSDREYEFAVAGVREGPGGEGPLGPLARTTTPCEAPSVEHFNLTSNSTSAPRQLVILWQKPSPFEARCRSGFENVTIHCINNETGIEEDKDVVVDFDAPPFYTLTNLTAFTKYSLFLVASNKDAESYPTKAITAWTLEEVSPAPGIIRVMGRTPSSFKLQWNLTEPDNICGNLHGYEILLRRFMPRPEEEGYVIKVEDDRREVTYPIKELTQNSSFVVQIRVVNGAGKGQWSRAVFARTMAQENVITPGLTGGQDENTGNSANQVSTVDIKHGKPSNPGILHGSIAAAIASVIVGAIAGIVIFRWRKTKRHPDEAIVSFKNLEEEQDMNDNST